MFDGCALDIKGKGGHVLRKPWRVCTNDLNVLEMLGKFVRTDGPKKLDNHPHGQCRGADCKASESYSWPMIRSIRRGFRLSSIGRQPRHADLIQVTCLTIDDKMMTRSFVCVIHVFVAFQLSGLLA